MGRKLFDPKKENLTIFEKDPERKVPLRGKNLEGAGAPRAGSDTSEVSARTARAGELRRRREEFRAATLPYYLRPGGSTSG